MAGGSVWAGVRVKIPKGPNHQGLHIFVNLTSGTWPGSHNECWRKHPLYLYSAERRAKESSGSAWNVAFLTRPALKRNYLTA
jgi:hypothetical protein